MLKIRKEKNMKPKKILSILLSLTLLPACGAVMPTAATAANAEVIRLNPSDASPFNNGEFQGWGTALCWWANRVGYSDKMTQQAATAFFSDEGLGLDIARYNLGGGDDPSHNHINRSDSKVPGVWETFKLSADEKDVESITYDITNDQNQLNIAKAALAANPDLYFEGFSNSAPYFMTVSGCTSGGDPASSDNLKADMYDDFGKFIADATKLFKDNGIEFQSYSPMNEPDTDYWGVNSPKQEGCHFSPGASQSKAITETRKALDAAGLTDVIVAGMDETSLKKTANNLGSLTDEAKTALGRIDTHTYSDRGYHAQVKAKAIEMNKNLWQSEVDKGGDGFTLASMIIEDMNGMQPSAWVMWDIVDFHKDSNFVDPTTGNKTEANNSITDTSSVWGVGMADHDAEEIKFTNKYYAYGQFTKYIEPGMTIITSSNKTLAAYDKKTGKIVIVALNNDSTDKNVTFDLRDFSKTGAKATVVRTNASSEKWAKLADINVTNKQFDATLKPKTVTTYVIEGDGTPVDYMTISGSNTIVAGVDYTFGIGGSSLDYIEGSVNWSVSDSEMADITVDAVSNTAVVKAKKGGTFTLTATAGTTSTSIEINALADGQTLTIVNKKSGLGLETKSKAINSGAQLVQWENRNLDTAAWTLAATEDGHFNIINKNADMLLAANADAKPVISKDIAATDNAAKWDLINHGGYFEIKNVQAEKSLNVSGQSVSNGGSVILYAFGGGDNELWSLSEITGNLEHVVPVIVDYSEKYKGTKYSFINNVSEWTNNFDENTDGFTLSGTAAITSDGNGESTLGVQSKYSNKDGQGETGSAVMTSPIVCEGDSIINIAFDLYCSNSGGTADFALLDSDGNEMVKMVSSDWDKYTMTVGESTEEEATGSKIYLRNSVNDKTVNQTIANGGHFEIYFTPSTGDIKLTLKNNTNSSALKTYEGNVGSGKSIGSISLNANYTSWSKPMLLDNLVTNIVEVAGNKLSITGTDEKTVNVSYTVIDELDGAALIGALYDGGKLEEVKTKKITPKKDEKTADTITFDKTAGDYDIKVMLWKSLDNTGAMVPLCDSAQKKSSLIPTPTDPPTLPESGELISLNFDNGDLKSTSTYGKASGTPKFTEVDGRKCVQFDNTNGTAIKLTDANGNPLLTGQKNITVSFKVKPTSTGTSWWFYTAPNDSAQTYQQEKYLGAMTNTNKITVERYNNSGTRSEAASTALQSNQWNDVMISFADGVTDVYVNGVKASADSTVNIADMLGKNSVCYIGKANWGTGEYATGYLDDFVIYNHAIENPLSSLDLGDLSAVTENITIPASEGVTWETSDAAVVTADGKVTRANETKTATLTAKMTKDGIEFTKSFDVTVKGYMAALDTFTAYVEGKTIKVSADALDNDEYTMSFGIYKTENPDECINSVENKTSAEWTNLENGTYYVDCFIGKKTSSDPSDNKSVEKYLTVKDEETMEAYLFVHFVDTQETADKEQIYFSVSEDGQTWTTLNDKKPVLTSNVGEKGVRDPYILRSEDGKFFIIATDLSIYNIKNNWTQAAQQGSKSIVVWESDDLVNWSEANLVKINNDNAGCTWAPEAVWDNEKQQYMVFWASVISDDGYTKYRIYRSYTSDFKTFSAPELYIEEPNAVIDTTIIDHKGVYYRFTKNEARSSITMQQCTSLSGNWKDVATYNLGDMTGYEGPTIYKINGEDKWCLLLDYFSKSQGYKPFVTSDITKGNFTAGTAFTFDGTYRHGTVMPITKAEYTRLLNKS